jgi:hypothetical protein
MPGIRVNTIGRRHGERLDLLDFSVESSAGFH